MFASISEIFGHTMSLNWLLYLPNSVACDILGRWLQVRFLARVDKAFCAIEFRHTWFQLLTDPYLSIAPEVWLPSTSIAGFLTWCVARNINKIAELPNGSFLRVEPSIAISFLERVGSHIQDVSLRGEEHSASFLILVSMYCTAIRRASISNCSEDDLALGVFLRKICGTVQSLHLRGCINHQRALTVCNSFPQLRVLRLDNSLSGAAAVALVNACVCLQYIGLANVSYASQVLALIAQKPLHLQVLVLRNVSVRESAFCAAFQALTNLHAVSFKEVDERFSDVCVLALVTQCPALAAIDLAYCEGITDQSLGAIAEHCPLRLTKFSIVKCAGVTMAGVLSLVTACTRISDLGIDVERYDTDDATLAAVLQQAPPLQHLDLSYMCLTGEAVRVLAARCGELTYLDLRQLREDSDLSSMVDLAFNARKLKILCVSEGTDPEFSSLACDLWRRLHPGLQIVTIDCNPFWEQYEFPNA